jgi:hypothetical protein
MVFTPEQKKEWSNRPEVQARQRQLEEKRRKKLLAEKPAHCRQCGVQLSTRRMFCTQACKARHHRQRPGVAQHLRQLQVDRMHDPDDPYRTEQHGRVARWKTEHPEAKPEERRRAHLRMLITRYSATVDHDTVLRDITYLLTNAAELKAALCIGDDASFEAARQRMVATVQASRAGAARKRPAVHGHVVLAEA